jgi:hypothetical protein
MVRGAQHGAPSRAEEHLSMLMVSADLVVLSTGTPRVGAGRRWAHWAARGDA